MAITEKQRRDLFTQLEVTLGTEPATTFMELVPTQPADTLVTRDDMHVFGVALRAELKSDMASLETRVIERMTMLETRLNDKMTTLETSLNDKMTGLEIDLTKRMSSLESRLTTMTMRAIVASTVVNVGAVIGVGILG